MDIICDYPETCYWLEEKGSISDKRENEGGLTDVRDSLMPDMQ